MHAQSRKTSLPSGALVALTVAVIIATLTANISKISMQVPGNAGSVSRGLLAGETPFFEERVLVSNEFYLTAEGVLNPSGPINQELVQKLVAMTATSAVDWERFLKMDHVIRKHNLRLIQCGVHIFMNLKPMEVWMSDRATIPQGRPDKPAIVFTVNLKRAIDLLTGQNLLGPCNGVGAAELMDEFGTKMALANVRLVAVFARDINERTLQEKFFNISMYPVPEPGFEMWRCDHHLTMQLWPNHNLVPCP